MNGWLTHITGAPFHDYAGSEVVHAMGGWLALVAIIVIGPRADRVVNGVKNALPIHNVLWMSMGSWLLVVGWFGFNVASAGRLSEISVLVAMNSLFAMVGGILSGVFLSKGDTIISHNAALAGLVAICSGSDVVTPIGALIIGVIAGAIFLYGVQLEDHFKNFDDVLGVWPLHGLNGIWVELLQEYLV